MTLRLSPLGSKMYTFKPLGRSDIHESEAKTWRFIHLIIKQEINRSSIWCCNKWNSHPVRIFGWSKWLLEEIIMSGKNLKINKNVWKDVFLTCLNGQNKYWILKLKHRKALAKRLSFNGIGLHFLATLSVMPDRAPVTRERTWCRNYCRLKQPKRFISWVTSIWLNAHK